MKCSSQIVKPDWFILLRRICTTLQVQEKCHSQIYADDNTPLVGTWSTTLVPFWCSSLPHIEDLCQYLPGPISTWKDHKRIPGTEWSLLEVTPVPLWQTESPKKLFGNVFCFWSFLFSLIEWRHAKLFERWKLKQWKCDVDFSELWKLY